MPSHARRTRPSVISAPMIARVGALIGIASPRPTPATAVLTPTTSPRPLTSAPPELPGIECRVGLDQVVDQPAAVSSAGGERAAERRDDAGRDRSLEAVRVPDRDDELADSKRLRLPEHRGLQAVRLRAQDRRGRTMDRGR